MVAPGTSRPAESTAFAVSWSGLPTVISGAVGVTTTRATLDACAASSAGTVASNALRRTEVSMLNTIARPTLALE